MVLYALGRVAAVAVLVAAVVYAVALAANAGIASMSFTTSIDVFAAAVVGDRVYMASRAWTGVPATSLQAPPATLSAAKHWVDAALTGGTVECRAYLVEAGRMAALLDGLRARLEAAGIAYSLDTIILTTPRGATVRIDTPLAPLTAELFDDLLARLEAHAAAKTVCGERLWIPDPDEPYVLVLVAALPANTTIQPQRIGVSYNTTTLGALVEEMLEQARSRASQPVRILASALPQPLTAILSLGYTVGFDPQVAARAASAATLAAVFIIHDYRRNKTFYKRLTGRLARIAQRH